MGSPYWVLRRTKLRRKRFPNGAHDAWSGRYSQVTEVGTRIA